MYRFRVSQSYEITDIEKNQENIAEKSNKNNVERALPSSAQGTGQPSDEHDQHTRSGCQLRPNIRQSKYENQQRERFGKPHFGIIKSDDHNRTIKYRFSDEIDVV